MMLPPFLPAFAPFSIRQLLQFDLLEQLPQLQVVSAAAGKEAALDKALTKMQADWHGVEFRVVEYKDTGTYVIGGTDDVQVCASLQALCCVPGSRAVGT
jgi:dynein heavy chain